MLENKEVRKDSIGQEVKVGNKIVYGVSVRGVINYYTDTLVGWTYTGRSRCERTRAKKKYVIIFEQ